MKKLASSLCTKFVLFFSVTALAGQPLRKLDPIIARPQSRVFGKPLVKWMETDQWRLQADQNPYARVNNIAFLSRSCSNNYTGFFLSIRRHWIDRERVALSRRIRQVACRQTCLPPQINDKHLIDERGAVGSPRRINSLGNPQ